MHTKRVALFEWRDATLPSSHVEHPSSFNILFLDKYRYYYGPDSIHAEFEADSCSEILGLPTCAQWLPDDLAFVKLLTHETNPALGAWCMIGIVAASLSTADGAILAMGTVWSHNVQRQFGKWYAPLSDPENLLFAARVSTIPFALAAALIASQVQQTGYLLIVALYVYKNTNCCFSRFSFLPTVSPMLT